MWLTVFPYSTKRHTATADICHSHRVIGCAVSWLRGHRQFLDGCDLGHGSKYSTYWSDYPLVHVA